MGKKKNIDAIIFIATFKAYESSPWFDTISIYRDRLGFRSARGSSPTGAEDGVITLYGAARSLASVEEDVRRRLRPDNPSAVIATWHDAPRQ